MSDIQSQLRSYMDQTVERVDVDDVLARTRVRKQWSPNPFVSWRPAWIAAAAALIMLISIGAVAAGAWLLRGEGIGEFAVRPEGGAASLPTWSGVLILGLAIGGSSIALLAGGKALTNLIHRMRDRRKTMQTIETPELELARLREDNARLGSAKRSLSMALVVLLIAVIATGAWLIVDNAGTATEREITALIDDYYAAWTAGDGEAVLALMTEDGTLIANDGFTYDGEQLSTFIEGVPAFNPERVGDLMIFDKSTTNTPVWLVASHTLAPDYPDIGDFRELELFRIVEDAGRLLIEIHQSWPER